MKLWYVSLIFSVASCVVLFVICFLPDGYTVFDWSKTEVEAGILFPVLLISWVTALLGFLFNNIFIDKKMMEPNSRPIPGIKAYLPTLLGLPAFSSFLWFIIRWYKGKQNI
jgi:hypothetical protein